MQKTILIVEDNDDIRNFLKKVLAANNFNILEAADGAQALAAVEKYLPDLVLLDFGLPKVPGETVLVKIKKDHPGIIVIALTEKIQTSDVVHGLQIGADDYIGKPFVAEELVARIDARFKAIANDSPEQQADLSADTLSAGPLRPPRRDESRLGRNVSEASPTKKENSELSKIILRESISLIIIRLIFTEAIFGISLFLFSVFFSYLSSYLDTTSLSGLYMLILVGGFLINIVIVILIVLKWNSEYTEISKDGVIKRSGILHRKEQTYACNFVEGAKLEQSFLGLLLNYGTIELYDPALKEQVYLLNIASPKSYSETIQNIVSNEKNKPIPFVAEVNNQK